MVIIAMVLGDTTAAMAMVAMDMALGLPVLMVLQCQDLSMRVTNLKVSICMLELPWT